MSRRTERGIPSHPNPSLWARRNLLDFGCDPETLNDDGRSCLHVAASLGKLSIVELLLDRGAGPNARDCTGFTASYEAVRNGHAAVAFALHKRAGQLGLSTEEAASELNKAVRQDNMGILRRLIANGAEPDSPDYDGRTCMHVAASFGNIEMVEFLIRRGVNMNHRDRWGGTPLSDAVREGHLKVVELLLGEAKEEVGEDDDEDDLFDDGDFNQHADPNLTDTDGRTVLHFAASAGKFELVEMLLSRRANPNVVDKWGATPITCAERCGFPEIVDLLSG